MEDKIKEERERIKKILRENWTIYNKEYKNKLTFLLALIDEKEKEFM